MAARPSSGAREVADALAITLEREAAGGAPWCPPSDAAALRRWVTDRSRELGGGMRRVVRLARLAAVADGGSYARFLYVQLPTLRARHFRAALQGAVTEGRLRGGVAALSEHGVLLCEPALTPQGAPQTAFEIDFVQMPRLAALLDFLHNSLGFAAVADLLDPVLRPAGPTRHADEVARALHAALNAWLGARLDSLHHIRQAQRMRAFLASRGRVDPQAIDDETILAFWSAVAPAADDSAIEGFRLYRSAARALLRYRRALHEAATAKAIETSLSLGQAAGPIPAFDRASPGESSYEPWRSPLRTLTLSPASRVKWLNNTERDQLLDYLGGPARDDVPEQPEDDLEAERGRWVGGLAGEEERFDLAFWLTLMRADVFGAVQASIIARLRKHARAGDAIAQAMVPVGDAAYAAGAASYAELRAQLRLECLAAVGALMEAGAPEALILLDLLGGRPAVAPFLGPAPSGASPARGSEVVVDAVRQDTAPALRAAIADADALPDSPARSILLEARAAARSVNRIGFRRDDRTDPAMLEALQQGAAAVVEVIAELDRLTAALAEKAARGDVAADRARFLATFRRIYLSTPES